MKAAATERNSEGGARSDGRRGILETLELRQRLTTAEAAARTQWVRRLRIALPLVAVGLVALFLLNTRTAPVDEAFLQDFANLEATTQELRMEAPRVTGIDDRGRPYEITAEAAEQSPGSDLVEFTKPRALARSGDEGTVAYAEQGVFQSNAKILELRNGVTVEHSIGGEVYVLKTPSATVSLGSETVESDAGVEGRSGAATLRADRMRATNGDGRVLFEGNVSMRIYPQKAKSAGADEVEEVDGR